MSKKGAVNRLKIQVFREIFTHLIFIRFHVIIRIFNYIFLSVKNRSYDLSFPPRFHMGKDKELIRITSVIIM